MFDKLWRLGVVILFLMAMYNHPDLHGFSRLVNASVILFCLNELFVNRASQGTKE